MHKKIIFVLSAMAAFLGRGFCDTGSTLEQLNEKMKQAIVQTCQQHEERGDLPAFSSEKAIAFFQKLDEVYLGKINTPSDEYFEYNALKGILTTPKLDQFVKDSLSKAIQLRDRFFQSVLELCNRYEDNELSKKLRDEIAEVTLKTSECDWKDVLLLAFGTSKEISLQEQELILGFFLENCVKFDMIYDVGLEYYITDIDACEYYEKIFEESFYLSLLDLFSKSDSICLSGLCSKYHSIKSFDDFIGMYFRCKSADNLVKSYCSNACYWTEFESALDYLYYDYIDDLSDVISFGLFE